MYLLNCLKKDLSILPLGNAPKNERVAWRHCTSKDFVLENHF